MSDFYLSDANSDLTGGADFSKDLEQSTRTTSTLAVSIAKGATETSYGFSKPNIPNNTSWATGTWTVKQDITSGNTSIFGSVKITRVNSAGVAQQSSATTAEQQMTNAGTYTFTLTSVAWTSPAVGDRIRVEYIYRNSSASQAKSITVQFNGTNANSNTPLVVKNTKAMNVTSTSTKTLSRVAKYPRTLSKTATSTPTLSRVAKYPRTLSKTAAGSPTLTKIAKYVRTLSKTATGTVTMARLVKYLRTLSKTATGTPTMGRLVKYLRTLSPSSSVSATMTRKLGWKKTLSTSSTASATLARVAKYLRTLSRSSTATATLERIAKFKKTLAPSSSATATMARRLGWKKALSVTSTATGTLVRVAKHFRTLSASSVAVTSLLRRTFHKLTLSVTSTAAVTMIRVRPIFRTLSATASGTATRVVRAGYKRTLSVVNSTSPVVSKLAKRFRTLTITVSGSAAMVRIAKRFRSLMASSTAIANLRKNISHKVSVLGHGIANIFANAHSGAEWIIETGNVIFHWLVTGDSQAEGRIALENQIIPLSYVVSGPVNVEKVASGDDPLPSVLTSIVIFQKQLQDSLQFPWKTQSGDVVISPITTGQEQVNDIL